MPVTISAFIMGIYVRLSVRLRVHFLKLLMPIAANVPMRQAMSDESTATEIVTQRLSMMIGS